MTNDLEANLRDYFVTAESPSKTRVQFHFWASNGFGAMAEAAANPNCADVIAMQLIEPEPMKPLPRQASWMQDCGGKMQDAGISTLRLFGDK
jgi:hypothetical protein